MTVVKTSAHRPDYGFIALVFFMILFGLVMLYSISPVVSRNFFGDEVHRNYFFNNQIKNFGLGLILLVLAYRININVWKKIAIPLMIISILLMLAVLIPGVGVELGGAKRWIDFGFGSIQPAEFMKIATVVYLAIWLESKGKWIRTIRHGLIPFVVVLSTLGLITTVIQKDLGTMVVLGGTMGALYFVAGAPWYHVTSLIAAAAAAVYGLIITFPHRMHRLVTFFNPESDPSGTGYHIIQVLISIGSGGIFGKGLGKSVQLYGYVPAPPTDSIFAIMGEELGLVGAVILVILIVTLAKKGFRIARFAPDTFSRFLATGLTLILILQAVINISAMLALIPLTGVPLPFISYGGSSLVANMVAVGILTNISRYTKEEKYAYSAVRWRNRWSRIANIGGGFRAKA